MLNPGELKRFLYSQHVYSALRMTLGMFIPGFILTQLFDQTFAGLACALGALCMGFMDVPAPLWRKHRDMLISTLAVAALAALLMLTMHYALTLWVVLPILCFIAGLAISYNVSTSIGIPTMLAMLTILDGRHSEVNLWWYIGWIIFGCVWYTYFSIAMCRLFRLQMAKRSLAECLYATADYLKARAQFYIPEIPLERCYRDLIAAQVTVIETQQAARELVSTNLFKDRHVVASPQCIRLFNMFTDVVDLHDSTLAMQVNFDTLRSDFAQTDALDFMRDLLHKTTRQLGRVAESIVTGIPLTHHYNVKAELRALEYEVQLETQLTRANTLSALSAAYSRGRNIASMTEKLVQDLQSTTNTTDVSNSAIEQHYYHARQPWNQLDWSMPGLRYAMRLTIAMLVGIAISERLGGHSIWIAITILMVLRPGFGLSQQRNKQRIIGSILGCLTVPIILLESAHPTFVFSVMAFSFLFSFSFLRFHYLTSVYFLSIGILLLYHFMTPGDVLFDDRILDTLIGAIIGTVAQYILPRWEYQLISSHIANAIRQARRFAQVLFAQAIESIDYRLARRDALEALTNLSASYQRMLQEPKTKQVQIQQLSELVVQCHRLICEIATLARTRAEHPGIIQRPEFQSTAQIVDAALSATDTAVSSHPASHDLFALQQSAIQVQQLVTHLPLPGMRRVLRTLRASGVT